MLRNVKAYTTIMVLCGIWAPLYPINFENNSGLDINVIPQYGISLAKGDKKTVSIPVNTILSFEIVAAGVDNATITNPDMNATYIISKKEGYRNKYVQYIGNVKDPYQYLQATKK